MTNAEIVAAIKEKTILEIAELVKMLEEEFGVSAAAPVMVAGGAAGGAAAEEHLRRPQDLPRDRAADDCHPRDLSPPEERIAFPDLFYLPREIGKI